MQYMVLTVLFPVIYIIIYKVLQNATINPKHYKLIRNVFICINLLLLLGLIGYILFTKIHLLKIFIIGIIAWIILAFLYKKIKKKNVIKIYRCFHLLKI